VSELHLRNHAGAQRLIRGAKGWAGLALFALALLLALRAQVPLPDALLRALVAGTAGMLLAWAAAIPVARQLVLAELEHHRRRLETEHAAAAGDER
jgi:hypothetical protein